MARENHPLVAVATSGTGWEEKPAYAYPRKILGGGIAKIGNNSTGQEGYAEASGSPSYFANYQNYTQD